MLQVRILPWSQIKLKEMEVFGAFAGMALCIVGFAF